MGHVNNPTGYCDFLLQTLMTLTTKIVAINWELGQENMRNVAEKREKYDGKCTLGVKRQASTDVTISGIVFSVESRVNPIPPP